MAARRVVPAALAVSTIGLAACNAILGIDPPIVADDASAGDAGGGGDAGPNVAGNVLQNPDFENSSCEGWIGNSATLAVSSISHGSGKHSCLVCQSDQSASVYTIAQNLDVSKLTPGVTYVLQAWLRLPDADSGLSQASALLIGMDIPGGLDETAATGVNSDAWTLVTESLPYQPLDGDTPTVAVLNRTNDNGCFLVDDFTMSPAN